MTPLNDNVLSRLGKRDKQQVAQIAALQAVAATVTKRVTVPIGSDGYNYSQAFAGGLDATERMLVILPVSTTRWRLKVRNYSPVQEVGNTGAITGTMFVGPPTYPTPTGGTTGRWAGLFASAPVQVATFATPADAASDTVTPWVTASAQQFKAGVAQGVSVGLQNGGAAINVASDARGLSWQGAGAAASAGNTGAPTGTGPSNSFNRLLDVRVEYETTTLAANPMPVGLFIGDSITSGWIGGLTQGAWSHEAWPGVGALQNGYMAVNLGAANLRTANWVTLSDWKWARADLATTVPDFAVYCVGQNNFGLDGITNVVTAMEPNFVSTMAILRGLGIPKIFAGTIAPTTLAGGVETARVAWNTWLSNNPIGIDGCFDFDRVARVQATPATADADFLAVSPHPTLLGYQRMGALVRPGRAASILA